MGYSRRKFILFLLILSAMVVGFAPPADEPPLQITETLPGQQIILRAGNNITPFHVPAPEQAQLGIQSAIFTINFNPPSRCSPPSYYPSATLTDWPADAKTAFRYAADIWASLLNSSVSIEVDACWWDTLGSYTLGSSGPSSYDYNFPNAPKTNTWYAGALAHARSNTDLNETDGIDWDGDGLDTDVEISTDLNDSFPWYFGTDGNTPSGHYDFVSVALHELGHGLGFIGSMNVNSGSGSWGYGTSYPFAYDRFTETISGTSLLNTSVFPNPSITLGNALTDSTNGVYFDGTNANAANGNNRVPLYTPSAWQSGSSYSHLAESFNETENALMTWSLDYKESEHSPGPVTLGIFEDLGWTVNSITQPDLQISQSVIGSDFEPGDAVSFVLSIENIGDAAATGVVVTDTLPAEILSPGWSTTFPGGTVSVQSDSNYVWDLPNLDPGDAGTITVNGTIDPTLPEDFSLTNSVSISTADNESSTANNSSSAGIGTFYSYLPVITKDYAEPLSAIELELLNLINAERANRGVPSVSSVSLLNQVAAAHSADMRDRNFFDHINPDGDDPGDRLTSAGYDWWTYGETIGAGYTSAQAVFNGWMDSDGHRDILLGSSYTEIGIGYETGGSWGHYWTAVPARPQ